MINRCIKVMWPTITKAVLAEAMPYVKQALDQYVFSKVRCELGSSCWCR